MRHNRLPRTTGGNGKVLSPDLENVIFYRNEKFRLKVCPQIGKPIQFMCDEAQQIYQARTTSGRVSPQNL